MPFLTKLKDFATSWAPRDIVTTLTLTSTPLLAAGVIAGISLADPAVIPVYSAELCAYFGIGISGSFFTASAVYQAIRVCCKKEKNPTEHNPTNHEGDPLLQKKRKVVSGNSHLFMVLPFNLLLLLIIMTLRQPLSFENLANDVVFAKRNTLMLAFCSHAMRH